MADQYKSPHRRSYLSEMPEEEEAPEERVPRRSPALTTRRRTRAASHDSLLLGVELSAVIMCYAVNFMDSLGGNISTPVLPFYGKRFGATEVQIGQLFSIFALTQTAAMPLLSHLSDLWGRRRVLLLSLAGGALGAFWQGLAGSYASLFAARAFSGVWAGVSSVCQVYIVDVVPQDLRVEYLGYLLSSTQASILFGPSIGAGLSALGLNVPILVQACVSTMLLPLVYIYLPESPEWIKVHGGPTPMPTPVLGRSGSKATRRTSNPGVGRWGTFVAISIYGVVALCSMIAQMSVVSMFAVFAKETYGLDSLQVGFCMTLGAIASIGTNLFLSPAVQRRLGNLWASTLGSMVMMVGATCTVLQPLPLTLASFMLTYLGIAINAGAVATGTANLTDMQNRSMVMMGVRMLKSLGAMVGPVLSGSFAAADVRLPFAVAALSALAGGSWQLLTIGQHERVKALLEGRRTVGLESALLESEGWLDEHGTPEEIRDLGEYVANLLTTRHYRWVTYNAALKNCLSDFFPLLPVESEEVNKKAYDYVRGVSRAVDVETRRCDDRMMMMS